MTGFLTGHGPSRPFWFTVIALGLLLRFSIAVIPGNQPRAPWSGGGDALTYVLLAENLSDGKGFSFALEPTALRAPGYPFLLASLMWIIGNKYVIAIRLFQFALGLGTVCCCSRASAHAFGERAGRASAIIGLFFPTLVFVTGEVLTECVGVFLASLFLYLSMEEIRSPRISTLALMGVVTSVAALFRFNMAALGFIGIWVACVVKDSRPAWRRVSVLAVCAGIVICPWLIRNQVVFQGKVLYSTLSGHDAVEGVLTPQGRALPGDDLKIKAAEGWLLGEVETNNPSRLTLPSEVLLNKEAWRVARALWLEKGARLIPLALEKLSYFWLSTDQIFWTQAFPLRQRVFRWGGVVIYWALLGLAVTGWFRVRRTTPVLANALLCYAVLITLLHLPFPMISRLRIPFMDPLIAILSGAAWGASKVPSRRHLTSPTATNGFLFRLPARGVPENSWQSLKNSGLPTSRTSGGWQRAPDYSEVSDPSFQALEDEGKLRPRFSADVSTFAGFRIYGQRVPVRVVILEVSAL